MFRVCHVFLSVRCSLVVTCWERTDLLALLCVMFYLRFVTFPCGVLGRVWCLICQFPIFAFFLTFKMVTYWERANLLALLYVMFFCVFVTFPCGVLGQVWYLIASIPDLCLLTYFSAYAKSSKFPTNESAIAQNNEAISLNADMHIFSNAVGPDLCVF